jgi:hypothetical protein
MPNDTVANRCSASKRIANPVKASFEKYDKEARKERDHGNDHIGDVKEGKRTQL